MLKQACFPINTVRNWRPNLFDLEKGIENTILILETIKYKCNIWTMSEFNHSTVTSSHSNNEL